MTSVFVTGSTGLIGSRVALELKSIRAVSSVFCLVRNPGHPSAVALKNSGCDVIQGDVTDKTSLDAAFSSAHPDVVVNCAGVLRTLDKSLYYAVNRDGVKNISERALKIGAKVVHISSLAAYGPSLPGKPRLTFPENSIINTDSDGKPAPVSDYGRSKLEGNLALVNSGVRYTIVVPSAVYGPRDKDMFFFFKIASMGISVSTPLKRTINLSYLDDVVKVITLSCVNPATDGKTYYAASPEEYDWEGVCKVISSVGDKKRVVRLVFPDFTILASAYLSEKITWLLKKRAATFNIDKAHEMLAPSWIAGGSDTTEKELGIRFTDFVTGASKTYNWYKENRWL